jgi:hypothetical protein
MFHSTIYGNRIYTTRSSRASGIHLMSERFHPERCKAMVSVSGYLIGSQESGKIPLPPKAEIQW